MIVKPEPAQFQIGVDLGTSFTKACFYSFDKDERTIVSWETASTYSQKGLLPSSIYLTKSNYLCLEKPAEESALKIKYFKMALAGQFIGKPIYLYQRKKNESYKIYTAFYLARVFAEIEKQIKKQYRVFLSDREIIYSVSLGIPVQYQDDSRIKEKFSEVLQAAWYMYPKIGKEESIQVIDMLYSESLQKPNNPDLDTVPELWAETAGMFTQSFTREGYYAIFDIGGGTVDGTLVKYTRHNGRHSIEFITAEVAPIGLEVAVHNMIIALGQDNAYDIRRLLLNSNKADFRELKNLQNEVNKHTARVIKGAKSKGCTIGLEYKDLPVIICGGGNSSGWYRNAIFSTYKIFQHYNCGIPPYKLYKINEAQGVFSGIHHSDMHRYLVAVGLSIPQGSGPEILGFPSQYPINIKLLKCDDPTDFDDVQYNIYGEYC
jgi:hypothetical protein